MNKTQRDIKRQGVQVDEMNKMQRDSPAHWGQGYVRRADFLRKHVEKISPKRKHYHKIGRKKKTKITHKIVVWISYTYIHNLSTKYLLLNLQVFIIENCNFFLIVFIDKTLNSLNSHKIAILIWIKF